MTIPSLIPSSTQLLQPFPRCLFLLEASERADCLVERLLSPGEFFGSLVDAVLDRSPAFDPCEQFLHDLGNGVLGDLSADRHSLRTVADRRAAVEGPAA